MLFKPSVTEHIIQLCKIYIGNSVSLHVELTPGVLLTAWPTAQFLVDLGGCHD